MVEQVFQLARGPEKAIEKVLFDQNIHYLHMLLPQEEGLPEHYSNSTVYLTVLRGTLSIGLDEQEPHQYEAGTMLKIPLHTKMNIKNHHAGLLELVVVKAPAPQG